MRQASISDLKARLSYYLREVRRGGEIQVLDRGNPVARLVPLSEGASASHRTRREELIKDGILRPGTGDASRILDVPPLELPASVLEALAEDREDRL